MVAKNDFSKSHLVLNLCSFLLVILLLVGYFLFVSELELRVTIANIAKLCDFEIENINARISTNSIDRSATWDVTYNTKHPINQTCSGTARPAWKDQRGEVLWRAKELPTNRSDPIDVIVGYSKFGSFSMCEALECDFNIIVYDKGILVVSVIKH